jgi:hypothetical protein
LRNLQAEKREERHEAPWPSEVPRVLPAAALQIFSFAANAAAN